MQQYDTLLPEGSFINGYYCSSELASIEVLNKYNQEKLTSIPFCTEHQLETAIIGAQEAFGVLRELSAGQRQKLLFRLANLLEEESNYFIDLIVAEAGKPKSYATAEIERCLQTLRIAAQNTTLFSGEMVPIDFANGTGKTAFTQRFPVGPIVGISPFNFPLNLALHKIAPALAVGCSIVLKPSPLAPLSALSFARLVKAAGFPAGAVNVVMADISVAEKLVKDDRLKMLSFTGSSAIGWKLKSMAEKKKVTLELGGNAAVIVDAGMELKNTATSVANGACLYAGQICISTQRIIVVEAIYTDFKKELALAFNNIKSGNPEDLNTINGPLISKEHFERISEWIKDALTKGANLVCGGIPLNPQQNIYAPTLLENVKLGMKVRDEEIFGPIAVLEKASDFEHALRLANNTKYGLQAGVFTDSIQHMKAAYQNLEVGAVVMNNVPGFRVDSMPYGGVKDSGLGREGLRYAMEDMTEQRLLVY